MARLLLDHSSFIEYQRHLLGQCVSARLGGPEACLFRRLMRCDDWRLTCRCVKLQQSLMTAACRLIIVERWLGVMD